MYCKAFTKNEVLFIQSRSKADVRHWMQREFGQQRLPYALIPANHEQIVNELNSGNHLMMVPAG